MTSYTSFPATHDIVDVQRSMFLSSYESYLPYRKATIRKVSFDPAPGMVKGTLQNHLKEQTSNNNRALGDTFGMLGGINLQQKASQKVQGGGDVQQKIEQVLRTDRSWR